MSDNLTYRLFEKRDMTGVLRLWKEESGWGAITEEQFSKWYLQTPLGECLTIVAVDENEQIVGQAVFVPAKILLDSKEKKALRFLAPILSKKYSQNIGSAGHPTIEMFRLAMKIAVEQEFSLVYAFPAFVWSRISKHFTAPEINLEKGLNTSFECYELKLQDYEKAELSNQIQTKIVTEFNQEFNILWQAAQAKFPIKCGIVRNAQWLQWKIGGRLNVEVRNSEKKLLGYVSVDKKTSLLVDALAENAQNLELVIEASLQKLSEANIGEIKLMKTDLTAPIIEKFGFAKVDFKFLFWRYLIDTSISKDLLDTQNWYLMPND